MIGPRHYKGDGTELTLPFQMLTDDRELVYEGRTNEKDFGPLDDFGEPNFGCTVIMFKDDLGIWCDL